jgi:coenzyme F420-reducing hydrogenase delta subunit/Pyruvate/2-oxoacid:ferredoxin oxidoreductase delta subunit
MVEFKRLQKWKNSLNSCIRCGYCYEHCQIYKSTRWEIDAPRGKLILLHGLLNNEIEPSDYLIEKLFECFHCGRCQKACSSGVPTLEVFADARADLIDAGYDVVGTTSLTEHERCAKCLNCVRMCKHEARTFVDGKIVTDRLKCQSCGNCFDICSVQGISIGHGYGTNPDQLSRQIDSSMENPNTKMLVFSCGWSSYPGFQASRYNGLEKDKEYQLLVTACAGRLKSKTVLESLEKGAWGVMVCSCPEDECEHGGSLRAAARMTNLQNLLEKIDIDPKRIRVTEIAQGKPKILAAAAADFLEELKSIGPLSVTSKGE